MLSASTEVNPNTYRETHRQASAMSMPPTLTSTNSKPSRTTSVRRVSLNVQYRLPM